MILKIYFYGTDIFTKSEIAIYIQAMMFCYLGLMHSSFIFSGPTIKNILVTYICNYLEITMVTHISNFFNSLIFNY